MLSVQKIEKSFGGIQAITNAAFDIPAGKVTALIGPNGAGKTTLFDMIGGFISADSGEILLNGQSIRHLRPDQRAHLGLSRTWQQVRLFANLRILDHLRMIEDHEDTKWWRAIWQRDRIDEKTYQATLHEFGIERPVKALASELSYGQRKLLDIALAVKRPHQLLMLDEPVAGVNKVVQEKMENLLLELKAKGETMLLIDHDMEFIRKLADHVIVLDAGAVLTEGAPEIVLKDPRVLEAYLGE